jgi:uncharacterized protein HemY
MLHNMFDIQCFDRLKPKTGFNPETAHVQPGAFRILIQHRANPASTSKSENLSGLTTRHPAVLLLQDEHKSTLQPIL